MVIVSKVFGIVNVTPDSFSDGGKFLATEEAVSHGKRLLAEGADFLDIGGESTRPGAVRVSAEVEQLRVLPVVEKLAALGAAISIDTMCASTAIAAVNLGATVVNDISGGRADRDMAFAVADLGVEYILTHFRGLPENMMRYANYGSVFEEVTKEMREQAGVFISAGVDPKKIILDPGIGFSKNSYHSWEMLRRLEDFVSQTEHRVLVGVSRKSFLKEINVELDFATSVFSFFASQVGVWAVRVHDVKSTVAALSVSQMLIN